MDYFWVEIHNWWESLDAEIEGVCCGVQVKNLRQRKNKTGLLEPTDAEFL